MKTVIIRLTKKESIIIRDLLKHNPSINLIRIDDLDIFDTVGRVYNLKLEYTNDLELFYLGKSFQKKLEN